MNSLSSMYRFRHMIPFLLSKESLFPSNAGGKTIMNTYYFNNFPLSSRNYAKGKDIKKSKGAKRVVINEEEMKEAVNVDKLKQEFSYAVEALRKEYLVNLSVRSSAATIDNLKINIDGKRVNLIEIARIIHSDPDRVIIEMNSHPNAIPATLKAISSTGMKWNPQQDGHCIFIPMPKNTQEFREDLSKTAKLMFNKCKEKIRDVQVKFIKSVKSQGKNGLSDDTIHRVSEQINEMANTHISNAELLLKKKQEDLLD